MRRITTYIMALSEYRVPISLLTVVLIVSNVIAAVVLTSCSSSTPHSIKSTTTPLVSTRQVSIDGRKYEILTNAQGLTLYYFYFLGTDITKTVCTGGCTTTWHPLLITDPSTIMAVKPELRGQLTAAATTNGLQVQHNDRFLYTYSGDKMPGQVNGNGRSVDAGVVTEIAVYSSVSPANYYSTGSPYIPLISAMDTPIHGMEYENPDKRSKTDSSITAREGTFAQVSVLLLGTHYYIADPIALMIVSPVLRGLLAAVPGSNGLQVQYMGHFLYTYSGDTLPGEVNGSAEGGSWTVAH